MTLATILVPCLRPVLDFMWWWWWGGPSHGRKSSIILDQPAAALGIAQYELQLQQLHLLVFSGQTQVPSGVESPRGGNRYVFSTVWLAKNVIASLHRPPRPL